MSKSPAFKGIIGQTGPQGIQGPQGEQGIPGAGQAKNLIINGDFRLWQRGTFFTNASYSADRWTTQNAAAEVQRVEADGGYVYQFKRPNDGQVAANHPIELDIVGQTSPIVTGEQYTLSLRAMFPAGHRILLTTGFSDIPYQGNIQKDNENIEIGLGTGAFENYTYTFTSTAIPLASSAVYEVIILGPDALEPDLHQLSKVQLERGGVATDFEYRHIGEELALCQRYYVASLACAGAGYATAANQTASAVAGCSYPVTMRASPVITYTHENGSNSSGTVSITIASASGCTLSNLSTDAAAGRQWWRGTLELNAEF